MSSRNNSCDTAIGLQSKLIALKAELKKAQSVIIQQQHMLQVQKQLMDRKQSIDKVKQKLINNLNLENQSLQNQVKKFEKLIQEKNQELEKLSLINKNLTAANNQLLSEITKQLNGPTSEEKEIRIQQIKRLSIIDTRPPPPPPLPLPPQKVKQQQEQQRKKPKRQLKQLHWEAVLMQKIEQTFWNDMDDLTIKVDFEQLEELFYQQVNAPQQQQITVLIQQPTLNQHIQILNQERSRSVELVIAKYRLTSQLVIQAVSNIDLKFLDGEKIEALMKCLPQGKEIEQMEKVKSMRDNQQIKLNIPEKFLVELYDMPFFEERLCSINFKMSFIEIKKSIDSKIQLVKNTCQQLLQCKYLEKFLLCCLAVGNYLNINTPKGIIKGFKLESIEKFNLIKGNDRETSLIIYIISIAEQENIPVFKFEENEDQLLNTQLMNLIGEVSKFSLIQIFNNEINQIKIGLKHLEKMLTINDQNINDSYQLFQQEVLNYYKVIENEYLEQQKLYEKLCDHYGENYQNYESEKVFQKFNQLFTLIKKAKMQSIQLKLSQVNESRIKETQTQLTRVRQSIMIEEQEQSNSVKKQIEQAKRLPLHELLKLKSQFKAKVNGKIQE
ncbi:unnamed protein product [Paramecium primaurelia]|uniref:FH2 domain-containing protein n=1 Tax=Paramecium primaurelia TaxID=5886 RepID=A0A8S1PU97_PARPR|nr:unnamed protein product [Paramecium primaurelia]